MSDTAFINLRGDSGNAVFANAANTVLNQNLPTTANTMTANQHRVYWLGPDEWLISTSAENRAGLLSQFRASLADLHVAITDVSGGYTSRRLQGKNATVILASGSTLDFDPSVFQIGQCAQTGLAKAAILIGHIDATPGYELIVRRTFSEYLSEWLAAAGA